VEIDASISRRILFIQDSGGTMRASINFVSGIAVLLAVLVVSPVIAQEKKAEKAKAEKVSGDIGLLDTEKNYMIVVTKDGKLVTIDYTQKTKVTELKASNAKMSDVGLGSSAAVQYTKKGEKNYLSGIEFTPAKGGD
jgi:biopolymer transport protein ExbD